MIYELHVLGSRLGIVSEADAADVGMLLATWDGAAGELAAEAVVAFAAGQRAGG